ncbi:MAG: ABC transporter permease [Anaerolineae bacterium]|nr:ABC transporter permease [Anaerolineae bacterium]
MTLKRHIVIEPYRRLFDLRLVEIWNYRSLLFMLTWREITIRYQQTLLGVMWVIIQPIINIIIYSVVFGILLKAPSENYPYVIYLFPALIVWRLMGDGISRGSLSLTSNSSLIEKVYFPRLVIVIATIAAAMVDFFFALLVLLVVMLLYHIGLTSHLVFIPFYTLLAVITILTTCVWLAPLNIRYRDVTHILPFIVQISMYVSPILYPITLIPESLRWVYSLNPMTTVVQGFRWCLLADSAPPDLVPAVIGFIVTGIILVFGLVFFKRSELTFADNI